MGHPDAPPPESEYPAQTGMVQSPQTLPATQQNGSAIAPQQSMSMIEGRNDTAVAAAAATASALVQARYTMAQLRPRNWMNVYAAVMQTCARSSFAEKATWTLERWDQRAKNGRGAMVPYSGPTIRFAEEVFRAAGNLDIRVDVLSENPEFRTLSVSVIDMESLLCYSRPIVLHKRMERAKLKEGQLALGQRLNSSGKIVYIVEATDDDLRNKQGAEVSKIMRTDGLRMIPADIVEDALQRCAEVVKAEIKADPAAVAKRLAYNFYKLGVQADQIEKFLGKPLHAVKELDLETLRGIHGAMSESGTTWDEEIALRNDHKDDDSGDAGAGATGTDPKTPPPVSAQRGAAGMAERVNAAREAAKAGKTPAANATTNATQREPGQEG